MLFFMKFVEEESDGQIGLPTPVTPEMQKAIHVGTLAKKMFFANCNPLLQPIFVLL